MKLMKKLIVLIIIFFMAYMMIACGNESVSKVTQTAEDKSLYIPPPNFQTTVCPETVPADTINQVDIPIIDPSDNPIVPTETIHKHKYLESLITPTCTIHGSTRYVCECGASSNENELPATGHKWQEWLAVKDPTETDEGEIRRSCSACGLFESKTIAKIIPHFHTYSETILQQVSCDVVGIKKYECSCGDSYTERIEASDHAWGDWVITKDATPEEYGVEEIFCTRCGDVASRTFVFQATNEDAAEIVRLFVQYTNEYREKIGSSPMTMMEECNVYTKLRSTQMAAKKKAEHSVDDQRAAANQLQYGYYVDPIEYGIPGEPYYFVNGWEGAGMDTGTTAECVAMKLATGFRNSQPHWSSIGAKENRFISVGVTYTDDYWYCCVIVSEVNLDENPSGI